MPSSTTATLGVLVDLSASMQESVKAGGTGSGDLRGAAPTWAKSALRLVTELISRDVGDDSGEVFVHAFGIPDGEGRAGVVDLIKLLEKRGEFFEERKLFGNMELEEVLEAALSILEGKERDDRFGTSGLTSFSGLPNSPCQEPCH